MKKLLFAGCLMLLLLPVLGTAQSQFDGTWKFNPSSLQFDKKPDEYRAAKWHVRLQDL